MDLGFQTRSSISTSVLLLVLVQQRLELRAILNSVSAAKGPGYRASPARESSDSKLAQVVVEVPVLNHAPRPTRNLAKYHVGGPIVCRTARAELVDQIA